MATCEALPARDDLGGCRGAGLHLGFREGGPPVRSRASRHRREGSRQEGHRLHRGEGGARVPAAALVICMLAIGVGWPVALVAVAVGCTAWAVIRHRCRAVAPGLDRLLSGGEVDPCSNRRPPGRTYEMLEEARATIARMRGASEGIADAQVVETAVSFCDGAEHLVDELARKPGQVGQARQFLTYYLAAGRTIVAGYAGLEGREDLLPQIGMTLERVLPALRDMTGVLQKQRAGLLSDEAFDLDVELSLLRKTMALDGLIDD